METNGKGKREGTQPEPVQHSLREAMDGKEHIQRWVNKKEWKEQINTFIQIHTMLQVNLIDCRFQSNEISNTIGLWLDIYRKRLDKFYLC